MKLEWDSRTAVPSTAHAARRSVADEATRAVWKDRPAPVESVCGVPPALAGTPALPGHGFRSAQAVTLPRMQQTFGNRAVGRFIEASRPVRGIFTKNREDSRDGTDGDTNAATVGHRLEREITGVGLNSPRDAGVQRDCYYRKAARFPGPAFVQRAQILAQRAGDASLLIQRDGEASLFTGDPRLNDPGFLICTAFCYLGIPPSGFKDLVRSFLEATFEEMRAAGDAHYERNFQSFHRSFSAYSRIRMMSKVFRFLMHGEIGLLGRTIQTAAGTAIRNRIIAWMLARGASHAGIVAAEAVLRKVVAVIDAAIIAGCVTYCGAMAMGRALVELSEAVAEGLSEGLEAISAIGRGVGDAIGGLLFAAVANAYGSLDNLNWQLSPALASGARADLSVLQWSLWARIRPGSPWTQHRPDQTQMDAFLANSTRSLASYNVPESLATSIAQALEQTIRANGGTVEITPALLLGMSPLALVNLLTENNLLRFRADPMEYGNQVIREAPAEQAAATP